LRGTSPIDEPKRLRVESVPRIVTAVMKDHRVLEVADALHHPNDCRFSGVDQMETALAPKACALVVHR
jgi:hypothetical protein